MIVIWALLAACTASAPEAPAARVQRTHPDVVLIVVDTLRADRLTEYGNALETTQGLRRLTRAATRFDNALAPASWTLPSTATILSGQHPLRHQVRRSGDVLPPGITTLAERLTGAGWRALGFSHNVSVSPRLGFDQGFARFTVPDAPVLDYPHVRKMVSEVNAAVDAAAASPDPLFLYLQPMNCHGPYKVPKGRRSTLLGRSPKAGFAYYQGPMRAILHGDASARTRVTEPYLQSLREQYDTAIRYTLDQTGRLLDHLDEAGRFDDALIILTADHGEELFDHGGFSHGYSLHREVLHVPLLVKLPGQQAGAVVTDPVTLADLLPTVLAAVSVPVDPTDSPVDGLSLLPKLAAAPDGSPAPPRSFVADIKWKKRCVAQSIEDGGWKLIHVVDDYAGEHDVDHLYDVRADPEEQHDLAASRPEEVARLTDLLTSEAALLEAGTTAPENHQDELSAAQLEALGYLE